jgi:hypothetical protein
MAAAARHGLLLIGFWILTVTVLLGRHAAAGEPTTISVVPGAETSVVEWSVSGTLGPVFANIDSPSSGVWPPSFGLMPGTAWQIDLQRRRRDERFISGITLEGTFNRDGGGAGQQLLGTDLFLGTRWSHRHWTTEATIGAGLEAQQLLVPETFYGSNSMQYHLSYQLGLYAQGTVAVAVPLSSSLALLMKVGLHLTAAHDEDWFAASTIGVRYTLP